MPFGGTTPEEDVKIEHCIERLKDRTLSKESKIKICKASVLKARGKKGS